MIRIDSNFHHWAKAYDFSRGEALNAIEVRQQSYYPMHLVADDYIYYNHQGEEVPFYVWAILIYRDYRDYGIGRVHRAERLP